MSRLLPLGLALAAALLLTACGGSNTKLIPEDRAQELKDTVDQVAQRVEDEECSGAESALRRARNQVSELPRSVDRGLKDNLNEWLDQVASRIEDDCKPEETPDADARRRPRRPRRPRPRRRRRPRPRRRRRRRPRRPTEAADEDADGGTAGLRRCDSGG